MTFEAWLFSAKRAWQNPWVKTVTIVTVACVFSTTIWFCTRVIGLRTIDQGHLVLHYTIEGGIDAIRVWQAAFLLPLTWCLFTGLDLVWAFGVYREDAYQAWMFFMLALAWSIPWMFTLWHLIRINS
jgi:hypothetical protein